MKTVEKVKLDKKTYKELKKMLVSSEEDFEMACSNIKNIDMSSVAITLLAKHLVYGKRSAYVKEFGPSIHLVLQTKNENLLDLSWGNLFKCCAQSPYLTDLDKELIQIELDNMIGDTLKSLDYKFIKKVNLELKW